MGISGKGQHCHGVQLDLLMHYHHPNPRFLVLTLYLSHIQTTDLDKRAHLKVRTWYVDRREMEGEGWGNVAREG